MDQRTIADEFELHPSLMTKAQYMILVAAIEKAGGEIVLDVAEVVGRSQKLSPMHQVIAYDDRITMRACQLDKVRDEPRTGLN